MKEQFVPYDLAIKLKEKGFDEPCFGIYNSFGDFIQSNSEYPLPKNSDKLHDDIWLKHIQTHFPDHTPDMLCTAPLWQQVIDWLESKHGVVINVTTFIRREDGKPHIKMFYVHKHPLVPKTFECEVSNTIKTKSEVIEHALTLI